MQDSEHRLVVELVVPAEELIDSGRFMDSILGFLREGGGPHDADVERCRTQRLPVPAVVSEAREKQSRVGSVARVGFLEALLGREHALADRPRHVVLFEPLRLKPAQLVVGPAEARRESRIVEGPHRRGCGPHLHAVRVFPIRTREDVVVDPHEQSARFVGLRDGRRDD